jgi:hypothetical protein
LLARVERLEEAVLDISRYFTVMMSFKDDHATAGNELKADRSRRLERADARLATETR